MNAHTSWGDMRHYKADLMRLMREERMEVDREVSLIARAVAAESALALALRDLYKPEWSPHAPHQRPNGA